MTIWVVSPNFSFPVWFDNVQEAEDWANENYGEIVPESQIDPIRVAEAELDR